jgi:anti-sigma factor RsiW
MMTCASCNDQLFDYVYGLFDEKDAGDAATVSAIRTHLSTCEACKTAYEKAIGQQKLLGEASRVPTTISFSTPKVEPRTLRFRQQAVTMTWYASAAALLIAVLGVMGGAYWWGHSSKWLASEQARLDLERMSQLPQPDQSKQVALALKLAESRSQAERQQQLVDQLEQRTMQSLFASTSYQQIISPTSVQNNCDTPLLIYNTTLNGTPVPGLNMDMDPNLNSLRRQQGRTQTAAAAKLNMFLPSVAYYNSAGKQFNNEVTDISNSLLGMKVANPLQVLHSEYLAHLTTDKPLYQPGEELFFRGIALTKSNFTVPNDDLEFRFKVTGPDGKVYYDTTRFAQAVDARTQQPVRDAMGKPMKGIGADSIRLPATMPSGEVTITLSDAQNKFRFPEQTQRVMVNPVAAPRFDKNLQFHRPSYAAGDEVIVTGVVKLPNQQPAMNTRFTAQIDIDDVRYDLAGKPAQVEQSGSTDATGAVRFSFKLPATVEKGRGNLALQFGTGPNIEIWTQPLRIETGQVHVECFPEGGDLVAGVPNDVYFQMRNNAGEAIDGEAELLDGAGKRIKLIETFHDDTEAKASRGMGKFNFTPKAGEQYRLRMTKPASDRTVATLPVAKTSGVALHVNEPVLPASSPLMLEVSNVGKPRELVIAVYCRQVLIALDRLSMAAPITQTVIIDSIKPLGGVYRVTVAEVTSQDQQASFIPLSERLIYRHPSQSLNLKLKAEPQLGRQVDLHVEAYQEGNQPSPAYVTIVGVNKSLLQLAEGSTQRRLPAHFLIANEVRQPEELEFADFFLSSHVKASTALDLLLGVQGWRRFKESSLEQMAQRESTFPEMEKLLPLQLNDNRSQIMAQVSAKTKDAVARSKEMRDLQALQAHLAKLTDSLNEENRQVMQRQEQKSQTVAEARQAWMTKQSEWQSFSVWFHLVSAGAMGVMSLAGLVGMLMKRSLLPMHLICTIGALSVLGLLGAAWLWSQQRPMAAMANAAPSSMPTIENKQPDVPKAESFQTGKPQVIVPPHASSNEKSAGGDSGSVAEQNRDKAVPSKGNLGPLTKNDPVTPPPTAIDPSSKLTEGSKPVESKDTMQKEAKANEYNSNLKSKSDSLRMKASPSYYGQQGMNNRRFNSQSNNDQSDNFLRMRENQRSTQLADTRAQSQQSKEFDAAKDIKDKAAIKLNPQESAKESLKPAAPGSASKTDSTPGRPLEPGGGLGGGGGFGGGGAGGVRGSKGAESLPALGGGTGGMPAPAKSMSANFSKKEAEQPKVYYLREYSWKQQARPAGIVPSTTWSQTVYWQPLAVVPSTGKLTIPVELPPGDGSYQFEVFGHDGQGRLGATSLEVKAPQPPPRPTPISLSTKLNRTEAKVGEVVQLNCLVENQTSRTQPNIIVKLQLPEGLRLPENLRQLRQAVRSTTAGDYVEPTRWYVQDRELILMWSELPIEKKVTLTIDLLCNKPGDYQASDSRAYLQNQERDACISPGLRISIK